MKEETWKSNLKESMRWHKSIGIAKVVIPNLLLIIVGLVLINVVFIGLTNIIADGEKLLFPLLLIFTCYDILGELIIIAVGSNAMVRGCQDVKSRCESLEKRLVNQHYFYESRKSSYECELVIAEGESAKTMIV